MTPMWQCRHFPCGPDDVVLDYMNYKHICLFFIIPVYSKKWQTITPKPLLKQLQYHPVSSLDFFNPFFHYYSTDFKRRSAEEPGHSFSQRSRSCIAKLIPWTFVWRISFFGCLMKDNFFSGKYKISEFIKNEITSFNNIFLSDINTWNDSETALS